MTISRSLIVYGFLALALVAAVTRAEADQDSSSKSIASNTLKLQEHFYNLFTERYSSVSSKAASVASSVISAPAQMLKKPYKRLQQMADLSRTWNFIQDPLHAFPNAVDLKVHDLFQRLTLFEINHAEGVRRVLTAFKVLTIMKVITVALVIGVALFGALFAVIPFAAVFGRRSFSNSWDEFPSVNWEHLQMLANVLTSIDSARTNYER